MNIKKSIVLLAEDYIKIDNHIFFIAQEKNIIYSLNIDTEEIELVDAIPENNIFAKRLGAKIIQWQNELIFVPMKEKKIWKYNLLSKRWKGYERKPLGDGKTGDEMFQAVLHKDTLFMIGSNYPAIIRWDLQTDEFFYVEEPYKALKAHRKTLADCYFRTDYVQQEEVIYIASCLANYVLKLNLDTLGYEWITVGNDKNRYSGIAWDGTDFWLAPRLNSSIVKWDGKEKAIEISLPEDYIEEKIYFLGAVCNGEKVIFPGFLTKKTLEISDKTTLKMSIRNEQYLFYKQMDNQTSISMRRDGLLSILSKDGEEKNIYCRIEEKKLLDFLKKRQNLLVMDNFCFVENVGVTLQEYMCLTIAKDAIESVDCDKENGRKIWEKLQN